MIFLSGTRRMSKSRKGGLIKTYCGPSCSSVISGNSHFHERSAFSVGWVVASTFLRDGGVISAHQASAPWWCDGDLRTLILSLRYPKTLNVQNDGGLLFPSRAEFRDFVHVFFSAPPIPLFAYT